MRTALLLVLSLATAYAHAQGTREQCTELAGFGELVMVAKELGTDIIEAMEMADNAKGFVGEYGQTIVLEAYDDPNYSTIEYQEKARNEFKSRILVDCMKGRLEK